MNLTKAVRVKGLTDKLEVLAAIDDDPKWDPSARVAPEYQADQRIN